MKRQETNSVEMFIWLANTFAKIFNQIKQISVMKTIVKIGLLALMLLSQTTVFATTEDDDNNKQDVPMQRRRKRMIDGTSTPTHAPARPILCPISVLFDTDHAQIEMSSTSLIGAVSYSIATDDNIEVDNGLINISAEPESIDVSNLPQGVYVIWITINDIDFAGEFEII